MFLCFFLFVSFSVYFRLCSIIWTDVSEINLLYVWCVYCIAAVVLVVTINTLAHITIGNRIVQLTVSKHRP